MLTTTGGIVIRTTVADIRPIGRNTQGVRLISVDDGDTVSSLAKLPEEELADAEVDGATSSLDGRRRRPTPTAAARRPSTGPTSSTTASAEAEASDHIDETQENGDPTLGTE